MTLYRMFATFIKAGVVREIVTIDGLKLYEMACRHNPVHPHFFCIKCRQMACLPSISVGDIEKIVAAPSITINNISINLSGVCKKCHAAI